MINLEKVVPLGKNLLALKHNLGNDNLPYQAVEIIAQTLKFYFVGIYVTDSKREKVILKAGNGKAGRSMTAHNFSVPIHDGYPKKEFEQQIWDFDAGTCVYSNEIQFVNRMEIGETSVFTIIDRQVVETKYLNEREIFWSPKLPETFRELFLPLTTGDKVIGVLEINSNINQDFSNDEILITNMLATYVAELIK